MVELPVGSTAPSLMMDWKFKLTSNIKDPVVAVYFLHYKNEVYQYNLKFTLSKLSDEELKIKSNIGSWLIHGKKLVNLLKITKFIQPLLTGTLTGVRKEGTLKLFVEQLIAVWRQQSCKFRTFCFICLNEKSLNSVFIFLGACRRTRKTFFGRGTLRTFWRKKIWGQGQVVRF